MGMKQKMIFRNYLPETKEGGAIATNNFTHFKKTGDV
jgi:hypothetical protein